MKFENMIISISDKTTGIIYDTIDISELMAEKIEEYKKYLPGDVCDGEAVAEEIAEYIESILKDLINNN